MEGNYRRDIAWGERVGRTGLQARERSGQEEVEERLESQRAQYLSFLEGEEKYLQLFEFLHRHPR